MNMRQMFSLISMVTVVAVGMLGYSISSGFYFLYAFILPVIWIGVVDMIQEKQSIRRNFPVLGRLRYVLEDLRPKFNNILLSRIPMGRRSIVMSDQ